MAVIEFEFLPATFEGIIRAAVKSAPLIPAPTFQRLGDDRLIRHLEWGGKFSIVSGAGGHRFISGTILLETSLKIWHVSIEELRAQPDSQGVVQDATAILMVSSTPTALNIQIVVLRLAGEISGQGTVFPPLPIQMLPLPSIGAVPAVISGFQNWGRFVKLLLGTSPSDEISLAGSDRLIHMHDTGESNDDWLLYIPAAYFVESVISLLRDATSPPPSGTVIETAPTGRWHFKTGQGWGVQAQMGLKKVDACPTLFGGVSVSVDVDVYAQFNLNASGDAIDITLKIETNASDWDTVRCWLGTGGIGSLVSSLVVPFLQWPLALSSLIAIGEVIRHMVGDELKTVTVDDFTKVSEDSNSQTYKGSISLRDLEENPIFARIEYSIGADGFVARGKSIPIPPAHSPKFFPDAGSLKGEWNPRIDCSMRRYSHSYGLPPVLVIDDLVVGDSVIRSLPVHVFSTSVAEPPAKWSVNYPFVSQPHQTVGIDATSVFPGDRGFVVIHCSAGLHAYLIDPVPAVPELSPAQSQSLVDQFCDTFHELTTDIIVQEIKWVEPPPGYLFFDEPLRHWQIVIANIPERADIRVVTINSSGQRSLESSSTLTRDRNNVAVEVVTDASTELILEINGARGAKITTAQRWLLSLQRFPLARPAERLWLDGNHVFAAGQYHMDRIDLRSLRHSSAEIGDLAANEKSVWGHEAGLRSISLPRGRVAAVYGKQLVIAVALPLTTSLNFQQKIF